MQERDQSTAAEFLVRNAPEEFVEGLNVLEKLNMPIHDKHSFQRQLNEIAEKAEDESKPVVRRIIEQFEAQDFPILSRENAFEKYWDRFPVGFPELDLPIDPRDEPDRPICEVFDQNFGEGTVAANCACRAYAEARRAGHRHFPAVLIGHSAGQRAESTGRCEV